MTWTGHPRTTSTPHRKARAALLADNPPCQCHGCPQCNNGCNRPATEADHTTPVAFGGPPGIENMTPLCQPCHRHKSSREGAQARWRTRATRNPEPHPGIR